MSVRNIDQKSEKTQRLPNAAPQLLPTKNPILLGDRVHLNDSRGGGMLWNRKEKNKITPTVES